jgi:hypothetical protein
MRQAGLRLLMATGQRIPFLRDTWGWRGAVGVLARHQNTNQKIASANAGTPNSLAMKYFPMMCLLDVRESWIGLKRYLKPCPGDSSLSRANSQRCRTRPWHRARLWRQRAHSLRMDASTVRSPRGNQSTVARSWAVLPPGHRWHYRFLVNKFGVPNLPLRCSPITPLHPSAKWAPTPGAIPTPSCSPQCDINSRDHPNGCYMEFLWEMSHH